MIYYTINYEKKPRVTDKIDFKQGIVPTMRHYIMIKGTIKQ